MADQKSWKQGLCNPCGDCGICKLSIELISYDCDQHQGCCGLFCEPCLVYKNAEGLNKSGVLYCLLGCISPCIPALLLRNEARDQYNIEVRRYTEYLNCL